MQYQNDKDLAQKAETALASHPYLKSADISVHVDEGEVTLDGVVDSKDELDKANESVRSIPGVKSINNQLRLRGQGSQSIGEYLDDTMITAAVKAKLVGEKGLSSLKIHVTTNDGIVELSGEVDTQEHYRLAADTARNSEGVTQVMNKLTLKP